MLERDIIPKSETKAVEPVYDTGSPKEKVITISEKVSVKETVEIHEEPKPEPETKQEENENPPVKQDENPSDATVNIGSKGLDVSLGRDCMICWQPFIIDWQHKDYTVCPSCREKLKNLIGV